MLGRGGGVNQEGRGGRESVPALGKTASTEVQRQESTDSVQFCCRTIWGGDDAERRGWRGKTLCKIYFLAMPRGLQDFKLPQPGMETGPSAVRAWSLNHCQ